MMHDVNMEYSESRGTWNVFVDGEWYLEGTYEQCDKCVETFWLCDDDEPEYYESYDAPEDYYESDDEYDVSPEDYREWVNANCGIDDDAPWLR